MLDSAFLDVLLVKAGYPTTVEIGIGDNLLIYPWIKRLVRMNKAFTVRRGLTAHEMMRSSQLMSRYIHYAVTQKKENIWIAQREGRAKDSDDRTQDSVLKMLAMGGPTIINNGELRIENCDMSQGCNSNESSNHNSQFSTLNSQFSLQRHTLKERTLNSQFYTSDDVERFEKYLAGQLAKINIPNKDEAFLRERMLTMYANPLRNYIAVQR